MTDNLTRLLHDTAQRVPTRLHPASDLRRNAQHHQRVRRTGAGAAAATLMAAAFLVGGGWPDGGQNRANELPATQPDLSQDALLIADEIPVLFYPLPVTYEPTKTVAGEPASPVTSCQRGTFGELGAKRAWTRTFNAGTTLGVTQVALQFDSARQAATAFEAVDTWFDSCDGLKRRAWRWLEYSAFGGRGRSASIGLPDPDDKYDTRYEDVGYAVNGSQLTVLTRTHTEADQGDDLTQEQPTEAPDPMQTGMLFALQRLDGSRNLAANAVPESFMLAEEENPSRVEAPTEPKTNLGAGWRLLSCSFDTPEALPTGVALRTGMRSITSDLYDPTDVYVAAMRTLQLGLYENATVARTEAEALRQRIAACAAEFGGVNRTSESAVAGTLDVHVAFQNRKDGFNDGGNAVTVVQQGNAVFVVNAVASVTVDNDDADALQDRAVELVVESVDKNLERICQLTKSCN